MKQKSNQSLHYQTAHAFRKTLTTDNRVNKLDLIDQKIDERPVVVVAHRERADDQQGGAVDVNHPRRILVVPAALLAPEDLEWFGEDRVMFGRPLNHTQTIQRRMADMARRITTAQLLSLRLGQMKDAGTMQPAQVSMAKWNNVRMAIDIARDARDILGGAGISAEYVPIRHMLNLESVITYEGTETIHQLVVGKELTGVNAFG